MKIKVDNQVCAHYIKRGVGRRPPLAGIARELFFFAKEKGIILIQEYIAGGERTRRSLIKVCKSQTPKRNCRVHIPNAVSIPISECTGHSESLGDGEQAQVAINNTELEVSDLVPSAFQQRGDNQDIQANQPPSLSQAQRRLAMLAKFIADKLDIPEDLRIHCYPDRKISRLKNVFAKICHVYEDRDLLNLSTRDKINFMVNETRNSLVIRTQRGQILRLSISLMS